MEDHDAGFPQDQAPNSASRDELLADSCLFSSRSSASFDLDRDLQYRDQQEYQGSEPSCLLRVYRSARDEISSYKRPGLKRDMASWTGVTILGTSFMM
jgi:hypothetical protein